MQARVLVGVVGMRAWEHALIQWYSLALAIVLVCLSLWGTVSIR